MLRKYFSTMVLKTLELALGLGAAAAIHIGKDWLAISAIILMLGVSVIHSILADYMIASLTECIERTKHNRQNHPNSWRIE